MIVRLFKPEDTSDIVSLLNDYSLNANACKLKSDGKKSVAPSPALYKQTPAPEILQKKLALNYTRVIEDNGAIIGFGSITETGRIEDLYIHKDYIGQGLATVIVTELEGYARHANIETITIICPMSAYELFKRLDYVLTDNLPHEQDDCVNLIKKIIISHPPLS